MLEIITGENIEKLRELAHKDSVNECVEWLTEHYQVVGEGVVKLQDENRKLKKQNTEVGDLAETLEVENDELKKELKGFQLSTDRTADENEELKKERCDLLKSNEYLDNENEELKEQLRTIQAMDKEEPCEQNEKLLEDVRILKAEKIELEDSIKQLTKKLNKSKDEASREHNSAFDYRMHFVEAEGQIKAYKFALKLLSKR